MGEIIRAISLNPLTIASITIITIAIITTSIAVLLFIIMAWKMRGKNFSTSISFITLGIFFSIFTHAGSGLLAAYDVIGKEQLLTFMGILLTIGSTFFIIAAWLGIRSLK